MEKKYILFSCKLVCFFLLNIECIDSEAPVPNENAEKRLLDHLMMKYDPRVRPVKNSTDPIILTIQMHLIIVEDLHEREQVLKSVVWMHMNWVDEYLQWKPKDFGGITYMALKPDSIWLPDLALLNSARSVHGTLFGERTIFRPYVTSDGKVEWITQGNVDTLCLIDLHIFPFDAHTCTFIISNWAYTANQQLIVKSSKSVDLSYYVENAEWQLTSTSTHTVTIVFTDMPFCRITFDITLKRKPGYVVNNIIVPTLLLSILSLLVFVLPVDSGEKISLSITILLSYTVFLLLIQESTPPTSDYVPLLVGYLLCQMVFSAASVICTVFVLNIHNRKRNTPLPQWIKTITFSMLGRVLFYPDWKMYAYGKNEKTQEAYANHGNHGSHVDFSQTQEDHELLDGHNTENLEMHLKVISDKILDMEREEKLCDELKAAAAVLDRLFFVLFLIAIIFCFLTLNHVIPALASMQLVENEKLFIPTAANITYT